MKAVVQKVSKANVAIDGKIFNEIKTGLLVLLAINNFDTEKEIEWMAHKLVNLRIFPDNEGKMNKSILDINGEILVISNFTIYGDVKKGFRPNFMKSAPADFSKPMYEKFIKFMQNKYPLKIVGGIFGAMMDINLTNSGPVTIILEKESNVEIGNNSK